LGAGSDRISKMAGFEKAQRSAALRNPGAPNTPTARSNAPKTGYAFVACMFCIF
jgi:hypothetical protein